MRCGSKKKKKLEAKEEKRQQNQGVVRQENGEYGIKR